MEEVLKNVSTDRAPMDGWMPDGWNLTAELAIMLGITM